MRLSNALSIGCNIGIFLVSDAFTFQPRSHYRQSNKLFVGNWENDDFLDSLGNNGENKSNSKENDNENGSKFARLMKQQAEIQGKLEQQQQDAAYNPPTTGPVSFDQLAATLLNQAPPSGPPQTPPYPPPQYQQPPPQGQEQSQLQNQPQAQPGQNLQAENPNAVPPPYPPQQQAQDPQSTDPNVQPQQQQPYQYPQNPYPYPPPQYQQPPPQYQQQTSSDGRRVGRNRDADSIANTADLYFAQLKLDSKVRKQAFLSGDNDKANQVFGDERVKVLKETLQDNPHITAARRKAEEEQKALLETTEGVIDKMVENLEEYERKESSKTYAGQSFKAKFAAKRGAKQKQVTKPVQSPSPVEEPVAQQSSSQKMESVAPAEPVVAETPSQPKVEPVVAETPPQPPAEPVVAETPKVEPIVAETPPEPVSSQEKNTIDINDQYENKSRQDIRTLQGLLMKHQGGPGFGAGVLKPNEGKRLEETLEKVTEMLKSEIDYESSSSPSSVDAFDLSSLNGSIECIQQALNMYNSASQDQKTALVSPLRSALVAAVKKFDEVAGEGQTDLNPPKPVYDKVNDEKLLNTYKVLKDASGEGKYGLKDLKPEEANELIDALAQMKGILLAELEMGKTAKASFSAPKEKSETQSKFEQMFARAKAEEQAGKTIGLD